MKHTHTLRTTIFSMVFMAGICVVLSPNPALADEPPPAGDEAGETPASAEEAPPMETPPAEPPTVDSGAVSSISVVATESDESGEEEEAGPVSGSVTLSTGIGLGTFVHLHPDKQIAEQGGRELVTTALSGSVTYKLGETLSLTSGMGISWYPVLNYAVGYENGRALLGDLSFVLSQSSIAKDEDKGLSLSGSISVGLPTSLGSQIQNRLFSLTPKLNLAWSLGDLSLSYYGGLAKYFMTSTVPSIDCDGFDDPSTCPAGRGPGPAGSFQTEKDGAELFLPSSGINSFTIAHGLGASYELIEGLSLSAGLDFGHSFSVVDTPIDEFSSVNAKAGRSHVDSLSSSLSLGYQATKQFGVGLSFSTTTGKPFGADGKDLVLFDTQRAPDNISTIGLSVSGSL